MAALRRIFATNGRAASKLNAMVGNADIQRELHILSGAVATSSPPSPKTTICRSAAIAPCRIDHPLMRALTPGG